MDTRSNVRLKIRAIKSGLPKLAHSQKMTIQLSRMDTLIHDRTAVEEYEYSFLCTYVVEFYVYRCSELVLRNMDTRSNVR